jgi:SPP1 gp7 family putative phage head morphogenesis protein
VSQFTEERVDQLLESTSAKRAEDYAGPLLDLLVATVQNDRTAMAESRMRLGEAMRQTMAMGEILGARLMLQDAADAYDLEFGLRSEPTERQRMMRFAKSQTVIPRLTLTEALEELISKTPVTLRRAADRTAQKIAELYSERNILVFARAAEASVTKEVQRLIAEGMRKGMSEGQIGRKISQRVDELRKRGKAWSQAYSRMVYRTNVNAAVTAGRFRQAQDPDIKKVVPAFRFDAVGDSNTRHNHSAGDGVILAVDNPAWDKLAPPLGYNCRCQLVHVSVPELRSKGRMDRRGDLKQSRIPPGFRPDPGFRHQGRPDLVRR